MFFEFFLGDGVGEDELLVVFGLFGLLIIFLSDIVCDSHVGVSVFDGVRGVGSLAGGVEVGGGEYLRDLFLLSLSNYFFEFFLFSLSVILT